MRSDLTSDLCGAGGDLAWKYVRMLLVVASECLLGWDTSGNTGQLCACLDCWVIAGFYCIVAFGPRDMGD